MLWRNDLLASGLIGECSHTTSMLRFPDFYKFFAEYFIKNTTFAIQTN